MALLNPPQTLPPVMFLIYRYLLLCAEKQTEGVATLLSLLAPPSLRNWQSADDDDDDDDEAGSKDVAKHNADGKEQRVVRFAFNALRELGIIDEIDGDRVRLSPELPAVSLNPKATERHFRCLVRDRVLDLRANADLWLEPNDPRPIGPRDLTRALAWVLAQDVFQPLCSWKDSSDHSVARLQQRQLGNEQRGWVFSNDTRWMTFSRWAVYLGFAWRLGVPKAGQLPAQVLLVPDPTEAVRDILPRLVPSIGAKVPLPEFLARLAKELPVLDGGPHRDAVLDRVDRAYITLPRDGELSAVLSHALLRLQDEEFLTLLNESDTDKRLFQIESGEPRPFSHIRIENSGSVEVRQ